MLLTLQAISQWCQGLIASWLNRRSLWGFVSLFLVGASLSLAIAACSGSIADTSGTQRDVKLTLVSYSVTKAAHDRIIPKFVEKWKKEHNQNVTFAQSYGGSGSQASAVIEGSQEADIVHLALALDIQRIEQAGLIEAGWEREAPKNGVVTRSVAAIVTRAGNPKGINTWTDLAKDGVKLIAANPKTSGIAMWEFLALWGCVTQTGGDERQALDYTTKVYKNTPLLTKDAREATDLFFNQGQGDVLINYENEVILAELNGQKLPYTIPEVNISIDNAVAVVDKEDWRQKRDDSKRGTSQECPECRGEAKKDLSLRIQNCVSAGGCHSLKYCCSKSFRRSPICRNCVSIFLIAKGEGFASPFSHRLTVG